MSKSPRSHQKKLDERARDIADGSIKDTKTVASITPGGGKSLAAAMFARRLLDAGVIDRVCWVCPRSSLASQGADGFYDPDFNPEYSARRADNTAPLVRDADTGRVAYTTTYQSVAANPDLHRAEFARHRYLLILDEPHHLADEEGRTWVKAISPLVEIATHVLMMTGTIERHDKIRIPFIEYDRRESDGLQFPRVDVEYSRRDALAERAKLEIQFTYQDGWARYMDGFVEKRVEISKATDDDISAVIQTFLSQRDYRDALVRRGLDAWVAHSAAVYPSRAIVICATQSMAREVTEFVRREYQTQVALAISDDADSERTIRQFRTGERGKILVTVGMAYEGLDVPDVTHVVCLTNTRSAPWLEQAFDRATRVDYKAIARGVGYERQFAWLYVPDDPKMRAVVEAIRSAQAQGIEDRAKRDREPSSDAPQSKQKNLFVGISAEAGEVSFGTMDERLTRDDSSVVDQLRQQHPSLASVPAHLVLAVYLAGRSASNNPPAKSATQRFEMPAFLRQREADAPRPPPPDSQEESKLRQAIEKLTRRRDQALALPPGSTNREIHKWFNKSRESMGIRELRAVLARLQKDLAA